MNVFSYHNKNLRINFKILSSSEFIKHNKVILTADGKQTKRKDNVVYTDGVHVGHFYRFTDDITSGVFVRSVFGLDVSCRVERLHQLVPVHRHYYPMPENLPAFKLFGYRSWYDFYATCDGVGLRVNSTSHGYSLEPQLNYKKTDSWVMIAGDNIANRLGYSSVSKLIDTYTAVTGKACIFNHGHLYLEVESCDNGIIPANPLEVF